MAKRKRPEPPEGYVYDGEHLVEAGLGTHHVVYAENGSVKGVIFCPYPLPELDTTEAEKAEIAQARYRRRRKGKK